MVLRVYRKTALAEGRNGSYTPRGPTRQAACFCGALRGTTNPCSVHLPTKQSAFDFSPRWHILLLLNALRIHERVRNQGLGSSPQSQCGELPGPNDVSAFVANMKSAFVSCENGAWGVRREELRGSLAPSSEPTSFLMRKMSKHSPDKKEASPVWVRTHAQQRGHYHAS